MVLRCMLNSGHGGLHMTPFMTIFVCFLSVLPSPILQNFNYMMSINTGRYPVQILIKFPFECHRNHVWGPIFDPCYDHLPFIRFEFLTAPKVVFPFMPTNGQLPYIIFWQLYDPPKTLKTPIFN